MNHKKFPALLLSIILLVGFSTSINNFTAFADDDRKDSKEYEKQKEKAEKARENAEEQKEKLKEKYKKEIEKLEEKTKQEKEKLKEKLEKESTKPEIKDEKEFEKIKKLEENTQEKIRKELEKIKEKAEKLEKDDDFKKNVDVQLSSVTDSGVTLCHIPPGNPENAHTITVGLDAAKMHMVVHGDTLGPCGSQTNIELILEEHRAKLSEKLAKIEEKRTELQEKFIEKAEKLVEKFEEKQIKRTEKLLEKINTGDYYEELIEDEQTQREFVLSFESLTADPIGKQSEILKFSGKIILRTSSQTDTVGAIKFKVYDCEIGNEDVSYSCKFGKARSISHGPDGEKNGLVIIATLDDNTSDYPTGLKAFVTADTEINSLEEGHDPVSITLHAPQSSITHQWFLSGTGSLIVSDTIFEDES